MLWRWGLRIIYESNSVFTVPFGFAGGLYDKDMGLVRFGLRDYDPSIGKWTAKDPIDFVGGDVNLFGYVGNNPVRFIDPYGLSATDDFLNWLGTVLGVVNPEPLVAPIAGALTDPNVPKLAILEKVNLYNLEQADYGTDNYIQPSWADQHPLEAWKIIIDYENEKKKKGTCPK